MMVFNYVSDGLSAEGAELCAGLHGLSAGCAYCFSWGCRLNGSGDSLCGRLCRGRNGLYRSRYGLRYLILYWCSSYRLGHGLYRRGNGLHRSRCGLYGCGNRLYRRSGLLILRSCLGYRSGCRLLIHRLSRLLVLGLWRLLVHRLSRLLILRLLILRLLELLILRLGLGLHNDERLVLLGLVSGVVLGVKTGCLADCHNKLVCDTQDNVTENCDADECGDTAAAHDGQDRNSQEHKVDSACIVSDLNEAYRQEMLTVRDLEKLAGVRILCLGSENEHVQDDTACDCDYRAEKSEHEVRGESIADTVE